MSSWKSTSFVGLCCCKLLPIWNLRVYLGARRMAVAVASQDTSRAIYWLDWPKTPNMTPYLKPENRWFFSKQSVLVSMRDFEEYHVMLVVSFCVALQRCWVITRLSLEKSSTYNPSLQTCIKYHKASVVDFRQIKPPTPGNQYLYP